MLVFVLFVSGAEKKGWRWKRMGRGRCWEVDVIVWKVIDFENF
jgi:hypothetical protein